jgi:glycosyltransferase involved in cell wall biosynthesis
MLENGKKFTQTLQLYKRFIVVSHYLKEHVQKINRQIKEEAICVIPTCVNYIIHEPKVYTTSKEVVTFGWIGGTTNLKYLEEIMPDLIIVSKKYAIELLVIGGKDFEYKTPFDIINLSWSFENEIEYLKKIDVGLMPLPLNKKTKGKGGFKLIQYMGLGIVSVGSAITINKEIIKEGEDGFLVDVNVKWAEVLDRVLKQKEKFALIGNKARQKINAKYSFNANFKTYQNFIYRA